MGEHGSRGCLAAQTSLRFTPTGAVHACCVNSRFTLGDVRVQSVQEIWESARRAQLDDALRAGDYSLGCGACGSGIAAGGRATTYAPTFDRFSATLHPDHPRRLEFALSNTCNLMCIQCSGDLSSAIRGRREYRAPLESPYGDPFFEQIRPFLAEAEVAVFLGGEPFLSRSSWRLWTMLLEGDHRPEVQVTTNGTILDERVERYVRELSMTVAVSLDAVSARVLEAVRVGVDHGELMANLERFRALTAEVGSGFGINACLMADNWQEFAQLFQLGDELGADVHVIVVTEPAERSLLGRDDDLLHAVIEAFEQRSGQLGQGHNAIRWRAMLDELRGHAQASSADVAVGAPGPSESTVRSRLEAARRALWGPDRSLVECAADGEAVRDSISQPWAETWETESWIGLPIHALPDRLGAVVGGSTRLEMTPVDDAIMHVIVHGAHGRVDVLVGEWVARGRTNLRILIGPPDSHLEAHPAP